MNCIVTVKCVLKLLHVFFSFFFFSLLLTSLCALQIASLECTKEAGPGMLLTEGISCALKAVRSDEIEFQKHHKWVAEYVEAKDQCLVQDENISRRLDLSVLQKKSVAQIPQSTVSANRIHEKVEL